MNISKKDVMVMAHKISKSAKERVAASKRSSYEQFLAIDGLGQFAVSGVANIAVIANNFGEAMKLAWKAVKKIAAIAFAKANMEMYMVVGNTYPYRQWLKNHGAKWNDTKKVWEMKAFNPKNFDGVEFIKMA